MTYQNQHQCGLPEQVRVFAACMRGRILAPTGNGHGERRRRRPGWPTPMIPNRRMESSEGEGGGVDGIITITKESGMRTQTASTRLPL